MHWTANFAQWLHRQGNREEIVRSVQPSVDLCEDSEMPDAELQFDEWPLNTLLVSRKHRVIYTPIAKNANTSFKRLFVRLSGHPQGDRLLEGSIHDNLLAASPGLKLGDYPGEEARRMLYDEDYYHFAVLRDPLIRAASAYLEKFVFSPVAHPHDETLQEVIRAVVEQAYARESLPADFEQSISFEQFARHLALTPDDGLDTHFKGQSAFLAHQRLDHIGTLEHMERLLPELESRFGQSIELEWENRTSGRKPVLRKRKLAAKLPRELRRLRRRPHPSELLRADLADALAQRFAVDIELWRSAIED